MNGRNEMVARAALTKLMTSVPKTYKRRPEFVRKVVGEMVDILTK